LVLEGLQLESEPGSDHLTIVIEGDVGSKLLPTDPILLAAVTLHFDLDEFSHLVVEVE